MVYITTIRMGLLVMYAAQLNITFYGNSKAFSKQPIT